MDPITAPWSAALTKLEEKRDTTIGTAATAVAGKIVLGFTTGTLVKNRQQLVGIIQAITRYWLARNQAANTTTTYYFADQYAGTDANISSSTTEPTGEGTVVIAVHSTFFSAGSGTDEPNIGGSQFFVETVKQLTEAYLEASKGT